MVWWVWLSIGIVMLIGEALVPGTLFLVFFALAAVVMGALTAIDGDLSLTTQLTIFASASITALLALRPAILALLTRGDTTQEVPEIIGKRALCFSEIKVGQRGRVELRGTTWQALNVGKTDLPEGADTTVVAIEGLLVHVIAQHESKGMNPSN